MTDPMDDLAPLLVPNGAPPLRWGTGTIVDWDPETRASTIEFRGGMLTNLPVLTYTDSLTFQPGDTVSLLGQPAPRGGVTSWGILGRFVPAGGTEASEIVHRTLTVGTLSVDELNAEEIFLDGRPIDEVIEEEVDPPPGGTTRETYSAAWSQSYRLSSGVRNDFNPKPVQGFWSNTNGNQRSLIGFPTSQIQSDLSGRTVTRVEVFLYYDHWYQGSGGTAVIGHHGHTSAPSTFSATTDVVRVGSWPRKAGRWVDYDHTMSQWASGAKTGIAIGPGPSTGSTYYGTARGVGESNPPRLRITSTV